MAIPQRASGWPLWSLVLAVLVVVGLSVGLIYVGKSWSPLRWLLGRQDKTEHAQEVLPPTTFISDRNGLSKVRLPIDEDGARERAWLAKLLEDQQKINAKILADLEALRNQKSQASGRDGTKEEKPPKRKRAQAVYVINEAKPPDRPGVPLYTLAVWDYIPCVLEPVLNSEIPGGFTVKITRPVLDATRTQILIPQGQRAGATADTANLLPGNERIPTWGISVSLPNGQAIELHDAQITDASGTNGLTGEVFNHTWRILWTSLFIRGLESGQQIIQRELGSDGLAPLARGLSRGTTDTAEQRLGRAQDLRPTIIAAAGDICNIRIPKPMQLPSFAAAQL